MINSLSINLTIPNTKNNANQTIQDFLSQFEPNMLLDGIYLDKDESYVQLDITFEKPTLKDINKLKELMI